MPGQSLKFETVAAHAPISWKLGINVPRIFNEVFLASISPGVTHLLYLSEMGEKRRKT